MSGVNKDKYIIIFKNQLTIKETILPADKAETSDKTSRSIGDLANSIGTMPTPVAKTTIISRKIDKPRRIP